MSEHELLSAGVRSDSASVLTSLQMSEYQRLSAGVRSDFASVLTSLQMSEHQLLSAGVRSDFASVLTKLKEKDSVRFSDFSAIWRELDMSLIFAGRQTDKELRQFTEECLSLACRMWIDSEGFQEQVCGLYLLYSLYMTQLDEPKSKIRVCRADWLAALKFVAEAHEQQHYDVEYVFNSLRFRKAFHFVATPIPIDIHMFLHGGRLPEEDSRGEESVPQVKHQPNAISEIMEMNSIEQLSVIHEKYHELKCAMVGQDASEPPSSLNFIQTDLIQKITKTVTAHEEWKKRKAGMKVETKRKESGATTSESEDESDVEMWMPPKKKKKLSIGQIRKQLKDKAFQEVSSPIASRRHRQVKTSDSDSSLSSPTKSGSGRKRKVDSMIAEEPEDTETPPVLPSTKQELLDMPLLTADAPTPGKQKGKGQAYSQVQCKARTSPSVRGKQKRGRGRPRKT